MDEIKRLKTFLKVVDMGSLSGAARDTVSVSSVARQIKALEAELGARLLNRNSRRLSLTEAGQRLYERGQRIVGDLEAVKSEVHSMHEQVKGTLRVAMRTSAGMVMVVPALPRFLAQYPEIEVEVILTDERLDFIKHQIDVAIWMGDLPNTDLIAKRLSRTNRKLCASPAYLEQRGTPQHPLELSQHNCLRSTAKNYGPRWWLTKEEETVEVPIRGSVRSENGLVLLDAALQGVGMLVIPEWMARKRLAAGELVNVMPEWVPNPVTTHAEHYAIYPSSRGLSRKIRAFVDFLVEIFADTKTG